MNLNPETVLRSLPALAALLVTTGMFGGTSIPDESKLGGFAVGCRTWRSASALFAVGELAAEFIPPKRR